MSSLLKNGRLIQAGSECPFTKICPSAQHCNRPKAMGNDFSCGYARAFDLLQKGGSFSQQRTIDGDFNHPSDSKPTPTLEEILSMPETPEEERKARLSEQTIAKMRATRLGKKKGPDGKYYRPV